MMNVIAISAALMYRFAVLIRLFSFVLWFCDERAV